ncbi:MAG: hypothetical protein Hyperionvirus1_181 [Hyperionvirus sp.]|uniref:Uncharacterized protein n=1 Tax=Hyperionvirus sp. TaxID=2487770 RepID=A0A3G5A6E8_9VIRU|nr:MAG: hypothetical protein Hyperionvirus1_181 [Hyperionvirus sp.]
MRSRQRARQSANAVVVSHCDRTYDRHIASLELKRRKSVHTDAICEKSEGSNHENTNSSTDRGRDKTLQIIPLTVTWEL